LRTVRRYTRSNEQYTRSIANTLVYVKKNIKLQPALVANATLRRKTAKYYSRQVLLLQLTDRQTSSLWDLPLPNNRKMRNSACRARYSRRNDERRSRSTVREQPIEQIFRRSLAIVEPFWGAPHFDLVSCFGLGVQLDWITQHFLSYYYVCVPSSSIPRLLTSQVYYCHRRLE
jgi:hypothetical protein